MDNVVMFYLVCRNGAVTVYLIYVNGDGIFYLVRVYSALVLSLTRGLAEEATRNFNGRQTA